LLPPQNSPAFDAHLQETAISLKDELQRTRDLANPVLISFEARFLNAVHGQGLTTAEQKAKFGMRLCSKIRITPSHAAKQTVLKTI
jgi:hypothetical protein